MKVKRQRDRLLSPQFQGPSRRAPSGLEPFPPAGQVAPADPAGTQPAVSRFRRWRRKWRAALTLGLLAETAVGGFAAAPQPLFLPPSGPATSTVMPPAAPTVGSGAGSYHPHSAGEYLPNAEWRAMAATAGQAAAEHLASSVVDLANHSAGNQNLTPEIKHYFIRLMMSGIGGLNPDEAADILEVSAENADDRRLGPIAQKITEWFVPGPQMVRKPPDGPGFGGHNLFDFVSAHEAQPPGLGGQVFSGLSGQELLALLALSVPPDPDSSAAAIDRSGPAAADPVPGADADEEPGEQATGSPAGP